ncbi:flippase-like domain-containing protein [Candidatus Saccharibacteria bacterium]|nr:flippase-like domain-containing protein [Candidatus Saccharibacteria bacterium]MBI3338048.1 flippase-like domain-containing protein [Candidatus Saccharibacteria bacterium]
MVILNLRKIVRSQSELARAKTVSSEGEVPEGTSRKKKLFAADRTRSGDGGILSKSSIGWLKRFLGISVLALTLGTFFYYLKTHSGVIDQLRQINVGTLILILGLYVLTIASLILVYDTILRLCGVKLSLKENSLLTIYSSIVNFFGPLQSGPGFRAVYLKKQHGVSLKAYSGATLLYYAFFAFISASFLFFGSQSSWHSVLFLLIFGAGIFGVLFYFKKNNLDSHKIVHSQSESVRAKTVLSEREVALATSREEKLFATDRIPSGGGEVLGGSSKTMTISKKGILASKLALFTLLQISLVATIYFFEIRATNVSVSFSQVLTYTGAANFALFVSLTPGALGFRESFLFFSQRSHHINSDTIVAANILDRGIYLILLGLLLVMAIITHARSKFGQNS